jgi:hypothetical protein
LVDLRDQFRDPLWVAAVEGHLQLRRHLGCGVRVQWYRAVTGVVIAKTVVSAPTVLIVVVPSCPNIQVVLFSFCQTYDWFKLLIDLTGSRPILNHSGPTK